eukprot:Platyproteum_vivax@DN13899_c0_g1_i1.p2
MKENIYDDVAVTTDRKAMVKALQEEGCEALLEEKDYYDDLAGPSLPDADTTIENPVYGTTSTASTTRWNPSIDYLVRLAERCLIDCQMNVASATHMTMARLENEVMADLSKISESMEVMKMTLRIRPGQKRGSMYEYNQNIQQFYNANADRKTEMMAILDPTVEMEIGNIIEKNISTAESKKQMRVLGKKVKKNFDEKYPRLSKWLEWWGLRKKSN